MSLVTWTRFSLASGKRYKVIYDRKGNAFRKKHGGAVYCKTAAEAKKNAEVKHFAVSRAMWGKNMEALPGGKVPSTVLDALKKAGDLDSLDLNTASYTEGDGLHETSIENRATSVSQSMLENIARNTDHRIQNMLDRQAAYLMKKLSREAGKL